MMRAAPAAAIKRSRRWRFAPALGVLLGLIPWGAGVPATAGDRVAAEITRLADLPTPVAGGGLLRLQSGDLLYAGGTTWTGGVKRWLIETYRYEPSADRWTLATPLPEPFDASVPLPVRAGGRWLLLGGETARGMARRGVALTEDGRGLAWESVADLPFGKAAATGGVIGDTLIVVGGADDRESYARGRTTVWLGRPQPGTPGSWTWQQAEDFPGRGHSVAAGAVYGGRLYVFGGLYADDTGAARNSDEAWSFSPADGWRRHAKLPRGSRGTTAVAVEGLGIVLAGGWGEGGPFGDVWLYRPEQDHYDALGTLPVPVAVASGVAVGRDVYLAGNEGQAVSRSPDVFRIRLSGPTED
jgi:N-acetylneuraminic acid mutarotase